MPEEEAQQQRDTRMKAAQIWDAKTCDSTNVDEVPESLKVAKYQTWVMGHDTMVSSSIRSSTAFQFVQRN